jgi:hypothetical protein
MSDVTAQLLAQAQQPQQQPWSERTGVPGIDNPGNLPMPWSPQFPGAQPGYNDLLYRYRSGNVLPQQIPNYNPGPYFMQTLPALLSPPPTQNLQDLLRKFPNISRTSSQR